MNSIATDCTLEASRGSIAALASTASCSSGSHLLPVSSVFASSILGSHNSVQQGVLSTRRKRKFPGPAGALPKLVSCELYG